MAEPKAPAATRKTDVTQTCSTRAEVDAFLEQVKALKPQGWGRGRLIFAMGATMSRRPSWDLALELQADMFNAVKAVGGLDVQLVYFRGFNECQASKWVGDPNALGKFMRRVSCEGGLTRLSRGAYVPFDEGSARQLRDLLTAVAVYATGGRKALENFSDKTRSGAAIRLLEQLG